MFRGLGCFSFLTRVGSAGGLKLFIVKEAWLKTRLN